MASGYQLDDAERLHRESPRHFSIPRRGVRESLPVGHSQAKLIFLLDPPAADGCRAERMWCLVTRSTGGDYVGELTSRPQYVPGLSRGATVRFSARHIAGVMRRDSAPMPPLVGCDLGVLRDGRWPLWAARVPPESPLDSGWRVFAATGVREARVRAISSSTLLRSWAVLDSVLDDLTRGVWRWDEAAVEFAPAPALPEELAAAAGAGLGPLYELPPGPEMKAVITQRALQMGPQRARRFAPQPDHADDSGWAFSAGDESQEQLDDPAQSAVVSFARLYHLFPYLERLAGEDGEGEWEWSDAPGDFTRVP